MGRKSNIFKPDIGEVNNNEQIYYSYLNNKIDSYDNEEDPNSFFKRLDREGSYIFSKNVIIKTNNDIYETKIAGKMEDRIITIDNKIIPIDNIVSITQK